MKTNSTLRLRAQLSILKDIAKVYGGLTIDNIIQQIESRLKELGNENRTR